MQSINLPTSVHIWQSLAQSVLVYAHHVVIFAAVLLFLRLWPGWHLIAYALGLVLWLLTAFGLAMLIGVMNTRFRDIGQIVSTLLNMAFYVSPILWMPENLGSRIGLLDANPFHHYLSVVRMPLMGEAVPWLSWAVVTGITAMSLIAGFALFARFRARLVFWV